MAADGETKAAVVKGIQNLFQYQKLDVLLKVEAIMQENRVEKSVQNRNPCGEKKAGPCRTCNALRPPTLGSAPWYLRENEQGEKIPRGATCQPCEWVSRGAGRQRSEWPYWKIWEELIGEAKAKGEPLLVVVPPKGQSSRGTKRKVDG